MTAHEEHDQGVVPVGDLRYRRLLHRRQHLTPPARLVAPFLVDQAQTGGPKEPAVWIGRDAVARPVFGSGEQRFLDSVLGRVEVRGSTRERAEDPRRQLAQQVLDF